MVIQQTPMTSIFGLVLLQFLLINADKYEKRTIPITLLPHWSRSPPVEKNSKSNHLPATISEKCNPGNIATSTSAVPKTNLAFDADAHFLPPDTKLSQDFDFVRIFVISSSIADSKSFSRMNWIRKISATLSWFNCLD
ncbi:hypothetical protein AVEN_205401-1 [Araneus ventricosus]|uniref:Uncharacterized protein n=1 Tax=Araneus ventricosus TaxID=182803 RepID=A0A4Y2J565_ARAVE|nr:hypothetical protein AVEN_205401-1 [Araneus ventricosus]